MFAREVGELIRLAGPQRRAATPQPAVLSAVSFLRRAAATLLARSRPRYHSFRLVSERRDRCYPRLDRRCEVQLWPAHIRKRPGIGVVQAHRVSERMPRLLNHVVVVL